MSPVYTHTLKPVLEPWEEEKLKEQKKALQEAKVKAKNDAVKRSRRG